MFIAEHNSVDAGASSTMHIVAIHDHILVARADADTDISIKTALTVQIYSERSPSTSLAYIRPHITKTLPLAYSLVSRVLSVPFFSLSSSTHYSHEQVGTNQSRFPHAGPACESVTVKTADRGS